MGMELVIYKARNHEVFKHEYWNNPEVEEVFYGCKATHFVNYCNFIPKGYEDGEFFEISVENVENMIEVACEYKNYWGNYNDVPKLCELRDMMYAEINGYEEGGPKPMKYYMEWDY